MKKKLEQTPNNLKYVGEPDSSAQNNDPLCRSPVSILYKSEIGEPEETRYPNNLTSNTFHVTNTTPNTTPNTINTSNTPTNIISTTPRNILNTINTPNITPPNTVNTINTTPNTINTTTPNTINTINTTTPNTINTTTPNTINTINTTTPNTINTTTPNTINTINTISNTLNTQKKDVETFNWKFTTLVLSGGGIRGTAIVGSLAILEEHGCLKNINCFSGTSIGALLCSLLCIGYTAKELSETIASIDINELRDIDLFNFFNNFGLDTGKKIVEYLETLFHKKGVDINLTFEDLYTKYGKVLITTGTSVNEHRLEVFGYKTHPKCKIIDAVRISTSIPFLYSAPKYQNNYYSDGGILDNYPVQCLNDYISKDDHVIGIKLMHDFVVRGRVQINKYEFPKYAKHLIYTAMDEIHRLRNRLSLYENKFENLVTIEIETNEFDSLPIELTQNDKNKLFSLGQHFTACWLEEAIEKLRN
jgi:predicted acylesterase/phospholipase RssA